MLKLTLSYSVQPPIHVYGTLLKMKQNQSDQIRSKNEN